MKRGYDIYESELIGKVGIVVSEAGVEQVFLTEEEIEAYLNSHTHLKKDEALCKQAKQQIEEYFLGKRLVFDVPLVMAGTSFRKQVWETLIEIPYGETRSYGEVAACIGKPKACRAVGGANRANELPIFIPCHRVVGSTGKLVGFMGARTDIQEQLLRHEKDVIVKREMNKK